MSEGLGNRLNAMSVDVEDYFHAGAFEAVLDQGNWSRMERRIERNTDAVLELFSASGVKATFFTLGWVAERHPEMIRRIVREGHELASHGHAHERVHALGPARFRDDAAGSRKLLEDISGTPVTGYRAPSFSIGERTPWAHEILAEAGYRYSSSIYPVTHDHYGHPGGERWPFRPFGPGSDFIEVPPATARIAGRVLPAAGGGWFRLMPYSVSSGLIGRVNGEGHIANFYFHPWELDPDQPRISKAPLNARFRHYVNLARMQRKIARLCHDFRWGTMREAYRLDRS